MSLIGIYDVTYDGNVCGSLNVNQDGIRTEFTLTARGIDGIVRLLCACGGKYVPIGILRPEGNIQSLKKAFSKNALLEKGLTAIDGCILLPVGEDLPSPVTKSSAAEPEETAASYSAESPILNPRKTENSFDEILFVRSPADGWLPEPEPWRHLKDLQLRKQCAGISGALVSSDGDATLLAMPFSKDAPFPLISAFRLGAVKKLDGKEYVVFRLEDGNPV